ncbi:MAG: methyltransferase domain-containing protein, partial [Chloroflexi bacterium]|nr:methyltransferase domain-containing protein [Chloroflexota bacterium]
NWQLATGNWQLATMDENERIIDYYNRNTNLFMKLGGSGEEIAAIHRQVWGPGVRTRRESFEYLNRRVAEALAPALHGEDEARLLDLGCGLGGTSTWMARRLGLPVTGVTISGVQARAAERRSRRMGLSHSTRFVEGDFHHLPDLGRFQAAWAIEAFIHSSDPARFFQQAAGALTPGGRLALADDFLASSCPAEGEAAEWLAAFRQGWEAVNLSAVERALDYAAQAGLRLVEGHDLTPYIRTVPAWILRAGFAALRLPLRWAFWESLRGSTALQECQRRGWTGYHLLVWEKG